MLESNDFRAAKPEPELRTGPVDEFREKNINRMTALLMWTLTIIVFACIVAGGYRVFTWIWP